MCLNKFRLACEKFSKRFLGRQGLAYNQGVVVGTSSNEQPRELLDLSAARQLTKIMTQNIALPYEGNRQMNCQREQENNQMDEKQPDLSSSSPVVLEKTTKSNCLIPTGQEEPVSLEVVRFLNHSGNVVQRIQLLHLEG